MKIQRIGIVGGGLSGLVTARILLAQGHEVVVFEQADNIGGVWHPSRHYPGLRTQSPRDCYAFSDFAMPADYPEFPDAGQVQRYLLSYADRHGLLSHVKLNTSVNAITRRNEKKAGWQIAYRPRGCEHDTVEDFDFVIVCNGVFSQPSVPVLADRDMFEAAGGLVRHSSQMRDVTSFEGRDVAIVGFGKSALDIAEAALATARRCSIVCHRTLWKVPRFLSGFLNAKHFILSRLSEFWLPHPDMRGARRFLHQRLPQLVKLYWFLSERAIGHQLGLLSPRLRPALRLRESVGTCFGLAPADDFRALRSGRLQLHVGSIARLTAQGILLDDGTTVPAQTIVLATGFTQRCDFLESEVQKAAFGADGVPRLYRYLVCPGIPDLAFNGYNGGGASQLTAEVGAHWLAALIGGELKLPDEEIMRASINADLAHRRSVIRTPRGLGYYAAPFMFAYLDRLRADLGLPPADHKKSMWRRYFTAFDPRDYAMTEKRNEL